MAEATPTATEATAPPNAAAPSGSVAVAVPTEIDRNQFVETFTVREGSKRWQVAANAVANKALMQINVSKLRNLVTRTLNFYDKNPDAIPEAKELKILADAIDTVEDLGARAYSDSKAAKGLGNSLERLVYAATAGAAAGNAIGALKVGANTAEARMRRLTSIGKAKDVTPERPTEPPAEQPVIDINK